MSRALGRRRLGRLGGAGGLLLQHKRRGCGSAIPGGTALSNSGPGGTVPRSFGCGGRRGPRCAGRLLRQLVKQRVKRRRTVRVIRVACTACFVIEKIKIQFLHSRKGIVLFLRRPVAFCIFPSGIRAKKEIFCRHKNTALSKFKPMRALRTINDSLWERAAVRPFPAAPAALSRSAFCPAAGSAWSGPRGVCIRQTCRDRAIQYFSVYHFTAN